MIQLASDSICFLGCDSDTGVSLVDLAKLHEGFLGERHGFTVAIEMTVIMSASLGVGDTTREILGPGSAAALRAAYYLENSLTYIGVSLF